MLAIPKYPSHPRMNTFTFSITTRTFLPCLREVSSFSLALAFFRSHLAMDTLDLSYILPAAGRTRDLRPLERALTGRT